MTDEDSTRIHPPWSGRVVNTLNHYQQSGVFHPFTCLNRGDGKHTKTIDLGVLIAMSDGWMCPDCSYTQKWAWDWMSDEESWPADPFIYGGNN